MAAHAGYPVTSGALKKEVPTYRGIRLDDRDRDRHIGKQPIEADQYQSVRLTRFVICCVSRETSSRTACRSRWMFSILTTLAMKNSLGFNIPQRGRRQESSYRECRNRLRCWRSRA